ncbi:MAG: hypothetical protein JNM99_10615 [Verrucomicrobiaceae bacterium]|nr:hypothetical protein [Verrucomicrobiaceae bacterium]
MESYGSNDFRELLKLLGAGAVRAIALCLLLHAVVFFVFDLLPDAAYSRLGSSALQKDTLSETRRRLGLQGSASSRYINSLGNLLTLDLGHSLQSDYPVGTLLAKRFITSLPVLAASLLIALCAMLLASRWYCCRALTGFQQLVLKVAPVALLPQFSTASMLAVGSTFAFAVGGLNGVVPSQVSDVMLIVSVALMPSVILFVGAAHTARAVANRPFVVTYESIGLPWKRIRSVLQTNILQQMLPLTNRVVLAVVTGTVFGELAFDRPGIGSVLADAVRSGDQPVASGWILAVSMPLIAVSQTASAFNKRFPAQ